MLDYRKWLETHVPVHEEGRVVETTTPFRMKKDSNDRPVRILLEDSWYKIFRPIFEVARISKSVKWTTSFGIGIIHTLQEYANSLAINLEAWGIPLVICVAGLFSYMAERAISLGKFAYKNSPPYGEGTYGEGVYGGGTVAHAII